MDKGANTETPVWSRTTQRYERMVARLCPCGGKPGSFGPPDMLGIFCACRRCGRAGRTFPRGNTNAEARAARELAVKAWFDRLDGIGPEEWQLGVIGMLRDE